MSEAAVKAIEAVMDLEPDDRRLVTKHLQECESDMAEVPEDVQDEIMAEVERRMAAYDANPTPGRPWKESLADIRAKFAEWKASQ